MISVVIPAKDPTQQLAAAISSVHRLLPDAEVIVVDDGSEPKIAGAAAARVLQQENAGPAAARNAGARAAKGDWLLFLDADDELLAGVLEAATLARLGEAGLVCGAAIINRHGGETIALPSPAEHLSGQPLLSAIAGTFLVRRDVFESAGGYDEHLRFGENTDAISRCAALTHVAAIDSPMVRYNAPADERGYDERRFAATVYILGRDRSLDVRARGRLHRIASVNASRVGRYGSSIVHGWLALRCEPSPQALARLLIACSGPLGRRWWLRQAR